MSDPLKVAFAVTGVPDTSGLRIKTTDPIGFYLSSKDPAAAQWHFEKLITEFLVRRKLLRRSDPGWSLEEEPNWPVVIISGRGEVTVLTMTRAEVAEVKRTGHRIISDPVQKLTVEWWDDPHGKSICIVRDDSNMVDDWIMESIASDLRQ